MLLKIIQISQILFKVPLCVNVYFLYDVIHTHTNLRDIETLTFMFFPAESHYLTFTDSDML